jgi:anti-sigma factor RsiW
MTDCPNAEIRDLLPDMVHGTLDGSARAQVEEHLASCADCSAELELLANARRVLAVAPQVDAARIAAAISRPAARRADRFAGAPMWRIAAGIALMVGGAFAWSLAGGGGDDGLQAGLDDDIRDQTVFASTEGAPGETGVSFAGRLGTLATDQLELLLAEMDDMDDVPALEPRNVLPVLAIDEGMNP